MKDNDNRGVSPIKWREELSEQTARGPQYEDQYTLQNKVYEQNALEEARLDRSMRRDEYRSRLKREEQREKMIRRESSMDITEKEGAIYVLMLDGFGQGISFRKVFSAKIKEVQFFNYKNSTKIWWQVTLREERTGREAISPLYTKEDLIVEARLKRTILVKYDCSDSTKSCSFLWKWIRKQLISMLNDVDVIEIPSAPGWHLSSQKWHFCSMSDEDTDKYTEYMRNFTMLRFRDLKAEDTLGSLIENLDKICDQASVGMLIQCRFKALLGRLTGRPCFGNGILIYGEKAEDVARFYLSTMMNSEDTINLDSDRIGKIREKICTLQDTPAIFLITNSDNRSVQNRLQEVMSWMQASCIEGKRLNILFVFCVKSFSARISLDNMLVLDASNVRLPKDDHVFEKFQCFIVEKIEREGEIWAGEIENRYESYIKWGNGEAVSMARTVKEVLSKMFDEPDVDIMHRIELRELLRAGEAEIEGQLSEKRGSLSEIFRDQVSKLVDSGLVEIFNRDRAPVQNERNYIFFDSEYYYFTKEVMGKIGKMSGMGRKSVLRVKQEIFNLSMLKKYRSTGQRAEELHVDFRICNAYGQRKDLSGLAVRREFFDEAGGIALCERG